MYICKYCGNELNQEVEQCPGCGGSSFETKADFGEIIIKEPPKGGYKINLDNYKKSLKKANLCIVIGTLIIILPNIPLFMFLLLTFLLMNEFILPLVIMMVPCLLIGIIVISIGINNRKISMKTIRRMEKLASEGILVKNMPYKLINTGMVMGKYYKSIQVNYKNSAGVEIPLYSETKYDIEERGRLKNTVDLLINPNDYSNYYIDYEIN